MTDIKTYARKIELVHQHKHVHYKQIAADPIRRKVVADITIKNSYLYRLEVYITLDDQVVHINDGGTATVYHDIKSFLKTIKSRIDVS